MLRGFAATRIASMDVEQGNGGSNFQHTRRNQRRVEAASGQLQATNSAASYSRAILGFCLVLLVFGVLPASFVLWACIVILVLTSVRAWVQHAYEQDDLQPTADGSASRSLHSFASLGAGASTGLGAAALAAGGGLGGAAQLIRVIPGGGGLVMLHSDPRAALDLINMRLRNLDEELENEPLLHPGLQYPALAAAVAATGGMPRPAPLQDTDIATLPCFPYKAPRGAPAPSQASRRQPCPAAAAVPAAGADAECALGCPPGASGCAEDQAAGVATRNEEAGSGSSTSMGQGDDGALTSPVAVFRSAAACGDSMVVCGSSSSSSGSSIKDGCGIGEGSSVRTPACCESEGQQLHQQLSKAAERQGAPSSSSIHEASSSSSSDGDADDECGGGGLTCPVCLDAVEEGNLVMTLPCLHLYHAACVTPWLRQQGLHATCPMCKTPVFR